MALDFYVLAFATSAANETRSRWGLPSEEYTAADVRRAYEAGHTVGFREGADCICLALRTLRGE
jgi:hypothetical protein